MILPTNTIHVAISDFELPPPPKEKPIKLEEDPLVTSCTWYRLRSSNRAFSIEGVTDSKLLSLIEPEDRIFAHEIREHFSKKLMMLSLKGKPFSNFRIDLAKIVSTDAEIITEKYFPIFYRLPEFYVYDTIFDEMIVGLDTNKPANFMIKPDGITLTPLKKLTKKRTGEYWFTNDEKKLFRLSVIKNNMLVSLLDKAYEKPMFFSNLHLTNTSMDGVWFLEINKFELG